MNERMFLFCGIKTYMRIANKEKLKYIRRYFDQIIEKRMMRMLKKRDSHKRAKRKYKKVMASLTGAAMLSSAMITGAPVAKASESVKTGSDLLGDVWQKSKDAVEERLREKIAEKATQAIDAVRNNPQLIGDVIAKTKDVLQDRARAEIENLVLEKKAELEKSIAQRLNPQPSEANRVINITATAYASGYEDNGIWNDKTHLGTKVRPGIIAVDPKVIPLGSKVYVEFEDGKGMYAVAEDTGGAIKGNRIDIAMENRPKAKKFGIQDVKVHVLEEGTIA